MRQADVVLRIGSIVCGVVSADVVDGDSLMETANSVAGHRIHSSDKVRARLCCCISLSCWCLDFLALSPA